MLKNLLKLNLKYVYRYVGVFYILAILVGIVSRIFSLFDDIEIFNIVMHFTSGLSIGLAIGAMINGAIKIWSRFIENVYKDESYLTHTLPTNMKTIYNSNIISSIIIVVTTLIVIILDILICYGTKTNMELLKMVIENIQNVLNINISLLVIFMITLIFLELENTILFVIYAIELGFSSNKNKMIKTVIYSIALYFLNNLVILAIIGISVFIYPDLKIIFSNNIDYSNNTKLFMNLIYLSNFIYLIFNLTYYFLGLNKLKKGVNVE